jgi:uncharacterized protein YhbP (UPF0306 family)
MDTLNRVRELMAESPFAVLCTQADSLPYGHVVAYAHDEAITQIAFCTPENTRKVRDMRICQQVALVIDNRARHPGDPLEVGAITATGRAVEIMSCQERDLWQERLLARHPYLETLMRETGAILFRVDLSHIQYVTRLTHVEYWVPDR